MSGDHSLGIEAEGVIIYYVPFEIIMTKLCIDNGAKLKFGHLSPVIFANSR